MYSKNTILCAIVTLAAKFLATKKLMLAQQDELADAKSELASAYRKIAMLRQQLMDVANGKLSLLAMMTSVRRCHDETSNIVY